MKTTLSLLILNWNGKKHLQKLLPSLSSSKGIEDIEVVIVDNGSTDDSLSFVEQNNPDFKIVKNRKNFGFARGCNQGIKEISSDWIVLLNNDTVVDPDWLIELQKSIKMYPQAGAIAPKLMFMDQKTINNIGCNFDQNSIWPASERGYQEQDDGQYDKDVLVDAFSGGFVALNRKMLQQIGLFDQSYFMYFEDTDLAWRARKSGWKFYSSYKSVAYHEHSGSSVEWSPFFTFHVFRNRLLIQLKNGSAKTFIKTLKNTLREKIFSPARHRHLSELLLGLKILGSFVLLSPVAILKRWKIITETRL